MKEILPFATIWMNLEEIMLSEVSQTEKDRYCMVLLLRRIFFFFFNLFILAVLDPPCCAGFSRVVVSRGRSLLRSAGFSLGWLLLSQIMSSRECRLQQLWLIGSVVVAPKLYSTVSTVVVHRLSCSAAYGILPDQGLNPCLLHWQADSLPLSQGSLRRILKFKKSNSYKQRVKLWLPEAGRNKLRLVKGYKLAVIR